MPRTDTSVSFLTGMIIAALYVILLVGFSRESYTLRGNHAASVSAACIDGSKQACALDRPICTPVTMPGREPSCVVSVRMLRQLIDQQLKTGGPELEAAGADTESD